MPERHDRMKRDRTEIEEIRDDTVRRDRTPNAGKYESEVSDIESNPDAGFDFDTTPTDEEEVHQSER